MNIMIFGAGKQCERFIRHCKFTYQMSDVNIIAICDNDSNKIGKR